MQAKILFVDDDLSILLLLKKLFGKKYQVLTAKDGFEALEIVKQHNIDVLVTDQYMPNMLGVELLQQVKAISPKTTAILLSSSEQKVCEQSEILRFLQKPLNNSELSFLIDSTVYLKNDIEAGVGAA